MLPRRRTGSNDLTLIYKIRFWMRLMPGFEQEPGVDDAGPCSCTEGSDPQSTTIPNGAPPAGIATGDPVSSLSEVPSTAKALIFATPASTT
jgi:hypothetical protein